MATPRSVHITTRTTKSEGSPKNLFPFLFLHTLPSLLSSPLASPKTAAAACYSTRLAPSATQPALLSPHLHGAGSATPRHLRSALPVAAPVTCRYGGAAAGCDSENQRAVVHGLGSAELRGPDSASTPPSSVAQIQGGSLLASLQPCVFLSSLIGFLVLWRNSMGQSCA